MNKALTRHYNQPHSVAAEANLEHVLEQAKHYAEGITDAEQRLLKKAAFLLFHLAYDAHIFADGNKRTAFAATAGFLEMNGYEMRLDGEESQLRQAAMMKETAEGKRSISYVFKWLKGICANK